METIVRTTVKREIQDADEADREIEERRPEPLPASDLCEILEKAETQLPGSSEEVRRSIGRKALRRLSLEHPSFFLDAENTEKFLAEFEEIIYPELSRLFPEMGFPEIAVEDSSQGRMEIVYEYEDSPCRFIEGLLEGLADRFGEHAEIARPECVKDGDELCRFLVRIEPEKRTPSASP